VLALSLLVALATIAGGCSGTRYGFSRAREADLALLVLVVSGGGLIVRCTSSGGSCSV